MRENYSKKEITSTSCMPWSCFWNTTKAKDELDHRNHGDENYRTKLETSTNSTSSLTNSSDNRQIQIFVSSKDKKRSQDFVTTSTLVPIDIINHIQKITDSRNDGLVATTYRVVQDKNDKLKIEYAHIGDTALFLVTKDGNKFDFHRVSDEPESFTQFQTDSKKKTLEIFCDHKNQLSQVEHTMLKKGFGLMHWVRGKNGNAHYYLYFKNGDKIENAFSPSQNIKLLGQKNSFTRVIYIPNIKKSLELDDKILSKDQVNLLCEQISQSYKNFSQKKLLPVSSYNFVDALGHKSIFPQSIKTDLIDVETLAEGKEPYALLSISDGITQNLQTFNMKKPNYNNLELYLKNLSAKINDDKSIVISSVKPNGTIFHGDAHGSSRGTYYCLSKIIPEQIFKLSNPDISSNNYFETPTDSMHSDVSEKSLSI